MNPMNVAFREVLLEPAVPGPQPSPRVTRVGVLRDLAQAEPIWRELQSRGAVASPYQNYNWIRLWHSHVSGRDGNAPIIVVAFDSLGNPIFLWPLMRRRMGPFTILTFFGDKHATLNMALWRVEVAETITADEMRGVLAEISRLERDLDFLIMFNQPERWHGAPNPFALLPHQTSNEDNFLLRLGLPGPQIIEREISATMRSRLRNKERKLAKLKGYRYMRAATAEDVDRYLDAFFAQKSAKLTALGIDNVFAQAGVEDFIRAACHDGLAVGRPVIELHALEGGGEILALFSGIHDGRRFTSMFNSHSASDHARYSPGLILLQHLVTDCANRGFESFDIGPGEARYKTSFCKEFEPIFDSILPLSPRGRALAPGLRLLLRARSAIKRNPVLWRVARLIRTLLSERNRAS